MAQIGVIDQNADDIYRYMNFDKIEEFRSVADAVQVPV
jgi:aconitate hydratase 2/2-methylisocitrate dehydratase